MTARLAAYVHVADERGAMHAFGPGSEVPEWAARKIVNPKAWAGGKAPYPADASAERKQEAPAAPADFSAELAKLRAEVAELRAVRQVSTEQPKPAGDGPPPKGGAGSGAPEWRAYAARKDVEVPADANREQVIDALTKAEVPTE